MCAGCAFRKDCETWHEPRNRVASQICAAGPLVFFCHAGIPWQDPLAQVLPVKALAQMAGGRLRVCEGWKRAVAARRWPSDPVLRLYQRMLARDALVTCDRFLDGKASVRELQRDLSPLAEYYRGPRGWQIERMVEHEARSNGGRVRG
jgi:hypothetical protein